MAISSTDGEKIIQSYPFKIRFAGLSGDTLSLASQGWSFAMNQDMNGFMGETILHLVLKHEGMGLYGWTNAIHIDRSFHSPKQYMDTIQHFSQIGFEVTHLSPNFKVCVIPHMIRTVAFDTVFSAIDPRPTYQEFDLKNLKFFTPANPQLKDIIVLPEQVPEMMEMILGAQKKTINEIKKRENSRKNYERYGLEGSISVKPAHEVKLQLVTLTG